VLRVDSSDVEQWQATVLSPAVEACTGQAHVMMRCGMPSVHATHARLTAFLRGTGDAITANTTQYARLPTSKVYGLEEWRKFTCDVCDHRVLNGPHEWEAHRRSKAHRAKTSRKRQMQHRTQQSHSNEPVISAENDAADDASGANWSGLFDDVAL